MNHEDLLSEVRSIAERVATSYALEIFDVQLRRESIGWVLRVVLDRRVAGGDHSAGPSDDVVGVSDCEHVSRDLSVVLDAELAFDHAYTLEVSSPGLDRPLRHLNDCRRFSGRLAKIVTTEAIDGQRHLAGRLTGVEGQEVVIESEGRIRRIPWSAVSRAQLEVEF